MLGGGRSFGAGFLPVSFPRQARITRIDGNLLKGRFSKTPHLQDKRP